MNQLISRTRGAVGLAPGESAELRERQVSPRGSGRSLGSKAGRPKCGSALGWPVGTAPACGRAPDVVARPGSHPPGPSATAAVRAVWHSFGSPLPASTHAAFCPFAQRFFFFECPRWAPSWQNSEPC